MLPQHWEGGGGASNLTISRHPFIYMSMTAPIVTFAKVQFVASVSTAALMIVTWCALSRHVSVAAAAVGLMSSVVCPSSELLKMIGMMNAKSREGLCEQDKEDLLGRQ